MGANASIETLEEKLAEIRGEVILLGVKTSERSSVEEIEVLITEVKARVDKDAKFEAELDWEIRLLCAIINILEQKIEEQRLAQQLEGMRLSPEQEKRVAAAKDEIAEVNDKLASLKVRDSGRPEGDGSGRQEGDGSGRAG
ncbi:hypothetical protein EJ06DRAFT_559459 [Trichodelitschia bisporula]|uniref:Uncharacterized protein n=1 Tax=Trichodelitschia bisporula TaxID=703511 RepID=A0A6G1HLT4_9PEZI|nr:hypothetical protein EJ06DRAFT_559459 [Trichodelitschia bisporula]